MSNSLCTEYQNNAFSINAWVIAAALTMIYLCFIITIKPPNIVKQQRIKTVFLMSTSITCDPRSLNIFGKYLTVCFITLAVVV